ncbi:hypothetical protein ACTFIT_003539 [Dictyostelium discoideum]
MTYYGPKNWGNIISFILICISCCALIPTFFTNWYYVNYYNIKYDISEDFTFYSTKIVQTSSYNDIKTTKNWNDFNLKSTHKIINSCLAFSIIAFVLGILSLIAYFFKFRKHMYGNKRMPVFSRIAVILMFIFTIISASILSGITKAFKNDLENFNNNNNNDNDNNNNSTNSFYYCNNSCDEKWSGEIKTDNSVTGFGPGPAFIIACCSLLSELFLLPCVFLFTFIPRI